MRKFFAIILPLLVLIFFLAVAHVSQAETPLEPGDGTGDSESGDGGNQGEDFSGILNRVFKFSVVAAALLAVVYIIIGGTSYVTAGGNAGKIEKGKEMIWNAIIGLLVVLGSYLILYTINPKLVDMDFNIEPLNIAAPEPPPASEPVARLVDITKTCASLGGDYVETSLEDCGAEDINPPTKRCCKFLSTSEIEQKHLECRRISNFTGPAGYEYSYSCVLTYGEGDDQCQDTHECIQEQTCCHCTKPGTPQTLGAEQHICSQGGTGMTQEDCGTFCENNQANFSDFQAGAICNSTKQCQALTQ